jgi:L-rhamnose mutarotase
LKPRASPGDTRNAYPVVRKAFRASIFPGQQFEYHRRHSPIWRELADLLIGHGVRTYSIYLDPATNDLFGYVEVASDEQWKAIQAADVCGRWWRYMREIMPARDDDSPVTADLCEVFHLEAP